MSRSEDGAALLAVLLLVAVMGALAAVGLERSRLATRLAANGAALDQARGYALGAEALALSRVALLTQRDRTTLAGGWHGRPLRLPVPGGLVTARLTDGGNCFNLNSVVQGKPDGLLTIRPAAVAQFTALMQLLQIAPAEAARVATALGDWIDSDAAPVPGGAEDETYLAQATPYRTANRLVADASELRAVAGVTPALYARVRPWICALPATEASAININTLAPDRAELLAMLAPTALQLPRVRQALAERPPDGWGSVATFWAQPALAGGIPPGEEAGQPGLKTRWYALALDVELGGAQLAETALLDGEGEPPRVVARSWGSDE